jgi:hypothetical protein
MNSLTSIAVFLGLCVGACVATYGVDVSQLTSEGAFSCLRSNGFDFAVVRVRAIRYVKGNCTEILYGQDTRNVIKLI